MGNNAGNIMVINMGLKSIRCIIFNYEGMKLGSASKPINTAINDRCVEQSPGEWWEKAQSVIKEAVRDARVSRFEYITVTASASCLVCIDKDGLPLVPALMISDKRTEMEVEQLSNMEEFSIVKKKTGLNAHTSLMLPKIMWVKNNEPEIFEKTAYFMTPNDYLIYKFCGAVVTDYFNAAKYHYILDEKTYPSELLLGLGIAENKLPEVKDTGIQVGVICAELADELGIQRGAQVVLSSYDAICSFIGSGVSEEGEASDVSGTVTVLRALSRKKDIGQNEKIYDMPFYQESARIIGGSNNHGGGLIEWVKQCYYQKEEYPYEIMEKDAGESEIGANGLIFLPYLLGERAPIWNDNARGVFFGLERMHTRKDMTRAVFESTGFIDMDMVNEIQNTGVSVDTVRLSGGLARLNLVSQIKADILNRDIMVLSEFETTSTGAAMIALVGQGVFRNVKEAAGRFVSIRMIIKPNRENHEKYWYVYNLYKDTYESLRDLFDRRVDIVGKIRNGREIRIENL